MQQQFAYTPEELERLKQSLSEERLGPYLALAGSDLREAIRLYERNTSLSEALYGLLQGLEVPLRNAMHHALSVGLSREDWYDSIVWRVAQQEQVDNAKESLRAKAKPVTPGRMVAELTFGFWVGLTGPKYSVDLWERHLYKAFPNAKLGRKQLNKRLESIRLLRNRVAHHEPILSRDLPKDVDRILETIDWISLDTEQWVRQTNGFFERFAR
jgi:Abi-like protein